MSNNEDEFQDVSKGVIGCSVPCEDESDCGPPPRCTNPYPDIDSIGGTLSSIGVSLYVELFSCFFHITGSM